MIPTSTMSTASWLQPGAYNLDTRATIPIARGIYAFYFDLSYLNRTVTGLGGASINVSAMLRKCVNAHSMANPPTMRLALHRKTDEFHSSFELKAAHLIGLNEPAITGTPGTFLQIASVLQRCTFLTSPIYIGITDKQDFRSRFYQHYKRYQRAIRIMAQPNQLTAQSFDLGGRFGDKIAKRGIEFRDLVFVCIPLTADELKTIKPLERFLHVIVNPVLSEQ